MKMPIRRILVAVKEVRGRAAPMLRKAAQLARATGAQVELFHAIAEPIAIDSLLFVGEGIDRFETAQRNRYLRRLEAMAGPLRSSGVRVKTAAEWDFPAHQAVVRRARATDADLIIAEQHGGRHALPGLMHYTDWELLRHSPVPVLLVKSRRPYAAVKLLAAVDPAHAFDKTASLDDAILGAAASVGDALRGKLHVAHAFVPSLADIPPAELTASDASRRIVSHAGAQAAERVGKALRAARLGRLPPNRIHLIARHPVDAIPELAKEHGFDIVVMGLARSGVKGFLIGNTAERVLDALPCDLLVVKPPGFRSGVPAKPRGPQLVSLGQPFGAL
jgi:universal stress protein E